MGLKEQIIFPEINYDKVDAIRGMDIVFVTTAKTDAEAKALLKALRSAVRQLNDAEFAQARIIGKPSAQADRFRRVKTGWPRRLRSTATRKRERMAEARQGQARAR